MKSGKRKVMGCVWPDSDYDILIIPEKKGRVVIDRLYDAVLDELLSTGRPISLKPLAEPCECP